MGFFLPHRSRRVFSIFKFSKLFPFSDFFEASSRKKKEKVSPTYPTHREVVYEITTLNSNTNVVVNIQIFFEFGPSGSVRPAEIQRSSLGPRGIGQTLEG